MATAERMQSKLVCIPEGGDTPIRLLRQFLYLHASGGPECRLIHNPPPVPIRAVRMKLPFDKPGSTYLRLHSWKFKDPTEQEQLGLGTSYLYHVADVELVWDSCGTEVVETRWVMGFHTDRERLILVEGRLFLVDPSAVTEFA